MPQLKLHGQDVMVVANDATVKADIPGGQNSQVACAAADIKHIIIGSQI